MTQGKGRIVLMGSGELTATMVEVHKALLSRYGRKARATFLDTPAGFQLNVDQISKKAVDYFQHHVGFSLQVASFKSRETVTPLEAEQAFILLKESDYILLGPGSPTYAVTQLEQTPIPEILRQRVNEGACLVTASAAALTVGRFTLPGYEIYKVGQPLHWTAGLDILSRFGLDLVVIPHWNNAEGGTHDTRFCFMGKKRLSGLEAMLPEDTALLGIDEHTACIMDLETQRMAISGIGRVTLRHAGRERTFESGRQIGMDFLKKASTFFAAAHEQSETSSGKPEAERETSPAFWDRVRSLETRFHAGLNERSGGEPAAVLLELDRIIWEAHESLEPDEVISQAREILREWIVLLGNRFSETSNDSYRRMAPLIEEVLALRQYFREREKWEEADALREVLARVAIHIEDTPNGPRWRPGLSGTSTSEAGSE